MKKNDKAFIATSVLFGIVALLFITFAIILGNSYSAVKNDKMYASMLKSELDNSIGIKLYPNGGVLENTKASVDDDGTYSELPIPTRDGYNFEGWHTDINEYSPVDKNTMYTGANKLYAHWSKKIYTLIIDPNDGTYGENTALFTTQLLYEDKLELLDPTRTGHNFAGWKLEEGGYGGKLVDNVYTMGAGNAKLTAQWTLKEVTLIIDPQSGTWEGKTEPQSFKLNYGSSKEIPDPVREGFEFAGWKCYDENTIISGKTVTVDEKDVTLYATWNVKNYKYKIEHYQQAPIGDEFTLVEADTVEAEAEFGSVVEAKYNNYIGFNLVGEIQNLPITSNESKNYVKYQYIRLLCLLKINPNGGTYDGELEKYIRYKATEQLKIPTRTGYRFLNWTASSGTLRDNSFIIDSESATLTANWQANTYILNLVTNGGYVSNSQVRVTYDSPYGSLETPTKTGYTFKGWSTTEDGKNIISASTIVKTASDHDLYAVWEPTQYTVTLNLRGGSSSASSITVVFNSTYSNLPTPTRANYDFLGWYTDATSGVKVDTTTVVSTADNHNLYARWLPKDASVIQYTNSTYTTCTNVACSLDELYQKLK